MKKVFISVFLLLTVMATLIACEDAHTDNTTSPKSTTAATTTASQSGSQDEALKRKLAGDWSLYLGHKEKICRDMYWMLDYIEEFYKAPNWETLAVARAAIEATRKELSSMESPIYSVTAAQHADLIASGCNVSGFWEELNRIESVKADFISNCDALLTEFYADIFFTPLLNCTKEYTDFLKTGVDIELELTASATDELIYRLGSNTIRVDFMAFLRENNPLVVKYLPDFSSDMSSISQKIDSILDKLEASTNTLNSIYGKKNVAADQLSDILKNKDANRFNALKLAMPEDENTLPLPSTLDFSKATFLNYYSDENDANHFATPGEPISFTPNCCRVSLGSATREEYISYVLMLSDLGIEPFSMKDSETELKAYYELGESLFLVDFSKGVGSILIMGEDLNLIPLYYQK